MSEVIDDVSDTALWVAVYRALESERPDAIFHDPFARWRSQPEAGAPNANALVGEDTRALYSQRKIAKVFEVFGFCFARTKMSKPAAGTAACL